MNKSDAKSVCLYSLDHTLAAPLLKEHEYPWEVLPLLKNFILELGKTLPSDEYDHPKEDVWIHRSAKVFDTAYLGGPLIIGAETEVRHCAFIRGSALIGEHCVVGNSTELKNVILFDNVQVPHYNYVGDSILGYRSHMGAGSITSNVKSDKKPVVVHFDDGEEKTGMKKFGAMIGDRTEIGCGSVLNPGCVIGRSCRIYPLSSVRKTVSEGSVYKKQGEIANCTFDEET